MRVVAPPRARRRRISWMDMLFPSAYNIYMLFKINKNTCMSINTKYNMYLSFNSIYNMYVSCEITNTHMCRLIQNATFICQSDFHFWTGQIPRTRHEESHQDLRCIDMFQSTNLLLFCVYVGSLQSYYTACQLYRHSIESRALTCPFKQSNLECLVTIDLTPHTYISLRETLFYPSCLLPTFTVTPSDSNYVNRSASLKHFS